MQNKHTNLRIVGRNVHGWTSNYRPEKSLELNNFMSLYKPHSMIIVEHAVTGEKNDKLSTPHDEYRAIYYT
jgi:hypothetical protein